MSDALEDIRYAQRVVVAHDIARWTGVSYEEHKADCDELAAAVLADESAMRNLYPIPEEAS